MTSTRAVYLVAADAVTAAGRGRAALRAACLERAPQPVEVCFTSFGRDTRLPYLRRPGHDPHADAADTANEAELVMLAETLCGPLTAPARARLGVFYGTSSGRLAQHEREHRRAAAAGRDPLLFHAPDHGGLLPMLQRRLRAGGPGLSFNTACSSAANALLTAAWMIRERRLDDALILASEWENALSQRGFHALYLASGQRARPFDAERDGFVLGECSVALRLSAQPPEHGPVWRLLGGASGCDTEHPTSATPQAIATTMRDALADAGRTPDAVRLIKAHGTATRANDAAEAAGILQLFGRAPPITALKPVFGHTLGACGALETAALLACLEAGQVPGVATFRVPDEELGVEPLHTAQAFAGGCVLLNYFGFGGNNCVLVLEPA